MQSLGNHILVEITGCNPQVMNDVAFIEQTMVDSATIAGATVINSSFHHFSPYGVSGVVVIQESHLAIHTWPEYGYAAVDLFTCGDEVDAWKAFDFLKESFGAKNYSALEMNRGAIKMLSRMDVDLESLRSTVEDNIGKESIERNIWFTDKDDSQALSLRYSQQLFKEKSDFQEVKILDTYRYGKMLTIDQMVMTTEKDEAHYHEMIAHPAMFAHGNVKNVLVIGGGLSGLTAAHQVGLSGANTLLLEQSSYFGGRAVVDEVEIDEEPSSNWVERIVSKIKKISNITIKKRIMASGIYDHGYVLAYERVSDHTPGVGLVRHRLWKIRAKHVILASGSIERPLVFPGNDIPGVMLASAVRDYVKLFAVSPGDRTVIITNNDDAYRTAIDLNAAGLSVPAIIDVRDEANGALVLKAKRLGINVKMGKGVAKVLGSNGVKAVSICSQNGVGTIEETIECDVLAMSGGWSPVVHLWSHCGGKLNWVEASAMFVPNDNSPPLGDDGQGFVSPVGGCAGAAMTSQCFTSAISEAFKITTGLGFKSKKSKLPKVKEVEEENLKPVWLIPDGAGSKMKSKAFLDFQNDVKVSDIKQAVLEGYESVEHAKRYTTLGMATDQGKLSNINGLAMLAHHLGEPISKVGTTTFRPPYTPISLGSIAGEARGSLFKPTRRTAIDEWSDTNGAHWEPVGDWRRPFTYIQKGETIASAVSREILNTRKKVGLLDASTLGKIMVKGPDAAKFLDLMYTNVISTLKVGKCRYGLMCNENGFLFDDGVVVRLNNDTFLCHTTSGGSDKVYSWMEEWLQTEWWNLKVFVTNITENFHK